MIKRGTGTIARVHAKNFTHREADARLRETVRPYQQQGLNALNVDAFEVYYYPIARSTTVCTCKQTEVLPQYAQLGSTAAVAPNVTGQNGNLKPVIIDYSRPLFGTRNENGTAQDETDFDEFDIDEEVQTEDNPVVDNTFATTANCGICYRTGFVPGYNRYGRDRLVLATHNMSNAYGYHMDASSAPHVFQKTDDVDGYVEFTFDVPRYFKQVFFSVRNNTTILPDMLYSTTGLQDPMTFAEMKYNAGKQITVRVLAQEFTHVALEFDLGTDPVLANMAQMSKTLDWTLFDTLGNLTLNLPMTIPNISNSDLLFVPQRNITLKITDVTYLRTSKDANLDWSCTTRVLQPQEAAKHIARSYLLV